MAGTSTKEKLLEAALDLVSQKGYSATSVDEIAESIGIKGPNIYKYFKGKEALLYAITDYSVTKYKEKMSMNIDISKLVHNKEELREFSLNQIKYTLTNNDIIRLRKMYTLEQFRDEHMRSMMTRQQYTAIMDIYIKIFTELIASGQIKGGEPEILALEYVAPTSLLIQLCDRDPSRMEEVLDMITRHIDFFIEKHFV
jgi:AcrR family transcriptional regulator